MTRLRRRARRGTATAILDKHSHRRRRRQGQPAARADRRGLRRRRADDLRPRPRPHGRDARQAAVDPRLRRHARQRERCARRWRRAGCAIVGQTATLAPADRRLYAIRDATGTVESIPLIVASILSKKLAAGLERARDGRQGRLRRVPARAATARASWRRRSSRSRRATALPTSALLTDMDRVLGRTAGNAVEVRESIDHLTGAKTDERLRDVTLALSEELLRLGGIEGADPAKALDDGSAAEHFARMVAELGGPAGPARAPGRTCPRRRSPSRRSPTRPATLDARRRARRRRRDHRPGRRPRARDRRRSTTPSG